MFITREAYKSPVSVLLSEIGEMGWSATELALQQVWFLVHLEEIDVENDVEYACVRTMLIFDFQSVEHILRTSPGNGIRLKSVHIVTPSHVNGTESWQMDPLSAVWKGRERVDGHEIPIDIFETKSGKRYTASFSTLSTDDMAGDTLKFQF